MPKLPLNGDLSIRTSISIHKRVVAVIPQKTSTMEELFGGRFGKDTSVMAHPTNAPLSITTLSTTNMRPVAISTTATTATALLPEQSLSSQQVPFNLSLIIYILGPIVCLLMLLGLSLYLVRRSRKRKTQERIYQAKVEAETARAQTRLEREAEAQGVLEEVKIG